MRTATSLRPLRNRRHPEHREAIPCGPRCTVVSRSPLVTARCHDRLRPSHRHCRDRRQHRRRFVRVAPGPCAHRSIHRRRLHARQERVRRSRGPDGHRVKIQNNVSVYAGVTLGDDVFVGPDAVFTNDLHPRAFNTSWTLSLTGVERGASIGANATIVCGVRIGSLALVAARVPSWCATWLTPTGHRQSRSPRRLGLHLQPQHHATCRCDSRRPVRRPPRRRRRVPLACGQRWQRPLESWSTT